MKIEPKHIAPYLPYGLKFIVEISEFAKKELGNTAPYENREFTLENDVSLCLKHGKPILRPLSDLTKLGDDDVKITEHTINQILGYGDVMFEHYKGDLDITIEGEFAQTYDSSKTVSFKTFETIRNELLKGHYDIFGLIENNLAIDINTLNK